MRNRINSLLLSIFCLLLVTPIILLAGECEGCEGECEESFDDVMIIGEFRWRSEADGKDFSSDTDMATYSKLRTRLGLKWKSSNLKGFLQIQYPHDIGWDSGDLMVDNNIDMHQAYFKIDPLICKGLGFKAGRFEMKYGDERLIGAVGWSNIGRTFDGMVISHKYGPFWWDLFLTKQVERSDPDSDTGKEKDDLFSGLWAGFKPMNIQAFVLHDRKAGQKPTGGWHATVSRFTPGVHHWKFYEGLNLAVLFDFAYQMGTLKDIDSVANEVVETDVSAWMAMLSLGYKLDVGPGFWFGAGFDMTSGDDPETADKNEGFDNLYYTGHKWRGYMDYFVESDFMDETNPGLQDIFVNAIVNSPIFEGCHLLIEFHLFSTMQDYMNYNNEEATALGNELNVVRLHKLKNGLAFEAGLGYFMPAEDWKGTEADNSLWGYFQLNKKFGK